jgi:hypothetical protein
MSQWFVTCRIAKLPISIGGHDLLFRKLDCAVINHIHAVAEAGSDASI